MKLVFCKFDPVLAKFETEKSEFSVSRRLYMLRSKFGKWNNSINYKMLFLNKT